MWEWQPPLAKQGGIDKKYWRKNTQVGAQHCAA